ncbi:hypothetical protein [Cloacibacillus sp. An23]|uniref:hypothetical protein n=1 Tax=Cloacibacillus sp. An23 TaxID=1965591 RepID=UPI000B39AD2C|nr:hypothetical protein [Cloacibacillus sp. An23]OUO94859.1 hypothetical protein B5F39_03055 [Cloacibacillus sp. An23]
MKHIAKPLAAALVIFCVCFFALPRAAGSYAYVSLIFKINENELERAAAALRAGGAPSLDGLCGVRGPSVISADGTVDFACASFGIAPAGWYAGIYNSPDGAPKGFRGVEMKLRRSGGGWEYAEPGGDNRYITRRIIGNWYYYRMSF